MEQKNFADKVPEVSQESVSSIATAVDHFQPNYTAQGEGSVVAPSIIGSSIGHLNISVISTGQVGAFNNHTAGTCDAQPQNDRIEECQKNLKAALTRRFSHLLEGMTTEANKVSLNKIYTELYITEGGSGEINKEHEVRQIEKASRTHVTQEKSIPCNRLFVHLWGRDCNTRTVFTRGVAGIGKTVFVNKFTLDWAEDKENTNLDFVFPLPFRELNRMKKKTLSLVELLSFLFPDTKDTGILSNGRHKMLFILDGLDESCLSLDFDKSEIISDVTEQTEMAVLLTNLIRGERLLPSALVWITSRPVASNQIPNIDLVTEVRGFNNTQKDEYFRRKISDESLANKVIAHVKSCRSLHIMCHIPVFCWMVASVLEKKLAMADSKDTPKILTQMYIYFLSFYEDDMNKRMSGSGESNADCVRNNLISLGELAFKGLEKGQLIFYESDLNEDGIKITQAFTLSGASTQIFDEQLMAFREKKFCFVQPYIQEFFAALYVFLKFNNDNVNVLIKKSSSSRRVPFRDSPELILYKEAVEKALQSKEGHFDIFLRFLLGLSLESNQALLKRLITNNRTKPKTRTKIIKHIKEKISASPPLDRCLNLFHCLNELNDSSLKDEIQSYVSRLNKDDLSPAQWATLVYVLLTSDEDLSVFKLSNYTRSEEGLQRLLPVIENARVANSNKVEVYLDWSAGTLSFFRVSCGVLTLLHTFQTFHTTFTEPVYPGFWLGWVDSTVDLC